MASITDILRRLNAQDFGRNDSTIASSIRHPIKAAGLASRWFQDQVNNAAGTGIPYDEANPFYTPDARRQEAAFNLAGMANLGSMPFAPKSAGGTLGTAIKPTIYDEAHEIARINAAKPISEGGLGLPENNTAMDRARALGFDVDNTFYHGTTKNFDSFDPSLSDTARKTGTPKGAMVVTSEPETANTYGMERVGDFSTTYYDGANVMPLLINKGKGLSLNAKQEGYTPNWNDLYSKRYPNIETTNDFAQYALSKKKDSATIKNVKDNARMSSAEGDTVFLFDPSRIRSINAAFDPLKRNSANLLASLIGGTALANQYDKKKRKLSITDKMKGAK